MKAVRETADGDPETAVRKSFTGGERRCADPRCSFWGIGVAAVLLHSLVDFPMQIPAIALGVAVTSGVLSVAAHQNHEERLPNPALDREGFSFGAPRIVARGAPGQAENNCAPQPLPGRRP
ncbi:MAG: hypothetical protein HY236_06275 [Acidobacteria bacterium]|nr:hypothetical protein [Acidobacteriota bacterium]